MLIIHNRNVLKNKVCRRVTARGSGREPLNDEPPEGVVLVALGSLADALCQSGIVALHLCGGSTGTERVAVCGGKRAQQAVVAGHGVAQGLPLVVGLGARDAGVACLWRQLDVDVARLGEQQYRGVGARGGVESAE